MDPLSDRARELLAAASEEEPDPERMQLVHASLATRLSMAGAGAGVTIVTRSTGAQTAPSLVAPGQRIDRYVVLERLGQGGMGVVFQAFDPSLQRTVALKLVSPGGLSRTEPEQARARLVAEARALAKLAHPNVVAVHDVGIHEGDVWLAMEWVDGMDLAAWRHDTRRTPDEIVRAYRDAARGLAAAHDAGLVHRDFKPQNVLIGRDGRVRVADFGLARTEAVAPPTPTSSEGSELGPASPALTRDGTVMGTPAYMAPEQHGGAQVGPAADQYAFFVALYEALWGRQPFSGRFAELVIAKEEGPLEPDLARGAAARWWPIVRKGLSYDPIARHADMHTVVSLLRPPVSRARTWVLMIATTAALGVAAWGFVQRAPGAPPCTGGADRFAEIWNADIARRIASAFAATEHPSAEHGAATVRERLDRYGEAWIAEHRETCEATRVRGEQSEAMLDRRMACLEERRRAVGALVDVLRDADRNVIDRSAEAVARLPDLSRCSNVIALERGVALPTDPTVREQVEATRAEIAAAEVKWQTGRFDDALAQAEALADRARALDFPPVSAEIHLLRARLLSAVGREAEASDAIHEALDAGQRAGHDLVVAEAALMLAFFTAEIQGRAADAMVWSDLAGATIERLGGDVELERKHLVFAGGIHEELGETEAAISSYEAALALDRRMGHEGDVGTIPELNDYAVLLRTIGRPDDAIPFYERAIEILEREVGPEDLRAGMIRGNLAIALDEVGRSTEAREAIERAVSTIERGRGPSHPVLAEPLCTLAELRARAGDDDVEPYFERGIALAETHGPRGLAACLGALGDFHLARGRFEAAEAAFARALDLAVTLGPEHISLGPSRVGMAEIDRRRGRLDDAAAHLDRARAAAEKLQGPDSPAAAAAIAGQAQVLRARGELEQALAHQREANARLRPPRDLEGILAEAHLLVDLGRQGEADTRIRRLRARLGDDPRLRAGIELLDARRRYEDRAHRSDAVAQASRARDALRELGSIGTLPADDIDAWLESHPPTSTR